MYGENKACTSIGEYVDIPRINNVYENILEEIHCNLQSIEEKLIPVMSNQPMQDAKEPSLQTRQQEQMLGILSQIKRINNSIVL